MRRLSTAYVKQLAHFIHFNNLAPFSSFHFLSIVTVLSLSTLSNKATTNSLAHFIGLVSLGFLLNFMGTSPVRDKTALALIFPQVVVVFVYRGIVAVGIFE